MGWFNFFSKKNGADIHNAANDSITHNMDPDIPKELFSDGDFKLQQGSLAANGTWKRNGTDLQLPSGRL